MDAHEIAVAHVRQILADVEAAMAMSVAAERVGESEEVLEEYGFAIYDQLGKALGIDPNSHAALAIVTALADSGRPEKAAKRMLREMDQLTGGKA